MFGKAGRMVRHLEATGVGLPPDHAVVVDAPDARAADAMAAARRGAYAPARALLAATREEADWALRDESVNALAKIALDDAAWLNAWRAESPDDPDALVVEAFRRIAEAWEVRTGAYAEDVASDRFRAFFSLLDDALPVIEAAIAACPGDPVPWSAALSHCTGVQAPRDVFDDCLLHALDRGPHHVPTHLQAVQFLSAKWHGSHEEMLDHAARAAAGAPQDSPVRALEVVALTEVGVETDREGRHPRKNGSRTAPGADRVDGIIATAQAYSASRPPEDRAARLIRNHLVWALNRQERWAESLDVYRSIGRYATESPWEYVGTPLRAFLHFRDHARSRLAASTPRNGTVPAPAVPLPESARPQAAQEIAYVPTSPQRASQELLLCGATVRLAPAGRWTLMEAAPSQETPGKRGRRATLLRLDGLAKVAETAFKDPRLTTLVAHREGGGSHALTVISEGRTTARHRWAGPGATPAQESAHRNAELFVAAAGSGDAREVARLLRDPGEPSELLTCTLATLGLPPLPAGFGERSEVLAGARGATVHQARSLWQGMKDFMSDDTDPNPPLQLDGR
ncbi:hypothetical protein CP967_01265 [Streptomyces nitrosporeus]|uniref:DUF4034 domain-containing protein n=2 Tax=Streptomyces nitrosporeus TaxID=28894 RepID=A0A5J6F453_9ACTN|nr:hypothetical protein [Streptomyces nitrosporeus]QEU70766.1 hypothetical protein CP967_01265 [Streptomyces nitrosporeus]GGZ07045.1 hypothetical protein GCM10010327_42150 [Streptomyces nitrosporeus]